MYQIAIIMEELAIHIINSKANTNLFRNFNVPLDLNIKVNDVMESVKVNFILHIDFTKACADWTLYITDRKLHCKCGDNITLFKLTKYNDAFECPIKCDIAMNKPSNLGILLDSLYKFIDCLVIDTEEGKFVLKSTLIQKQLARLAFNAEGKACAVSNECCVCLNGTKTKFRCNHSICYCCASKLKTQLCPLCRRKCSMLLYDEVDCDDDDDDEEEYEDV
jgi:hypothetical protein